MERAKILVVDDDKEMRCLLEDVLVQEGYSVTQARDGADALLKLKDHRYDLVIIDKNMPGLSGLEILPGIKMMDPQTIVVFITAFGDVDTYLEAMNRGAYDYLHKPLRMSVLKSVIEKALRERRKGSPFDLQGGV